VCLITGADPGIGKVTVLELAQMPTTGDKMMSKFTDVELEYLKTQRLGRLATINKHGEISWNLTSGDPAQTHSARNV